ncbi:hypothetical protein GUJ93_ZPchr0007g5028 [Zizania palustris]|uniref:Uncharacterized protein n=1 Tax=Zizania palustris TaxID=103762 RepID=A0A8J5TIQ2_ZIZPA|nr:hypothetical protein GUJ93_ZPchr0007g5028 [Zizania palustris]
MTTEVMSKLGEWVGCDVGERAGGNIKGGSGSCILPSSFPSPRLSSARQATVGWTLAGRKEQDAGSLTCRHSPTQPQRQVLTQQDVLGLNSLVFVFFGFSPVQIEPNTEISQNRNRVFYKNQN